MSSTKKWDKKGCFSKASPSDQTILHERHKKWQSKKLLQKLYHKWYRLIVESLIPGKTLELGGGSGNLKEFLPEVFSSDVVFAPWLDILLDAHDMPCKDESFDNVVLFDVLHHLKQPERFFYEVQRVLKEKGRLIMMEPCVSWSSFFIYRFLHQEGMAWRIDPFSGRCFSKNKKAYEGNQAIPTLIFEKYRHRFKQKFGRLQIVKKKKMDFFLYPLSGGFHHPTLLPDRMYPAFFFLERLCEPLSQFLAFRLFLVLEKK